MIGSDRESHQRDLYRQHRGGRLPEVDAVHPGHDGGTGPHPQAQSVRPDQDLAEERLSADRGRRHGAQPQSRRTTLPKSSSRPFRPPTSCPASASRRTRCCRRACSPTAMRSATGWASTSTTSRSMRRDARSTAIIATAAMRTDGNLGGTPSYHPNSLMNGPTAGFLRSRRSTSPVRRNAWDHRVDDDHWEQPGDLFRLMTPQQQQVLFENTARALGGAARHIQERHVANCTRADPAYGAGVARALGLSVSEAAA